MSDPSEALFPGDGLFPDPDVYPGDGDQSISPVVGYRPLTSLGLAMLAELPPVLQGSSDYQACIHALAREITLLESLIDQVQAQFNPATADVLLRAWEYETRLPVGGLGQTLEQRQAAVLTALRQTLGSGEGQEWEQRVDELVGPGWSYEEHIPGDATSPPENTLRITLPFPPNGSAYAQALLNIREFTAAHLAIEFVSPDDTGFILDESQLDLQDLE